MDDIEVSVETEEQFWDGEYCTLPILWSATYADDPVFGLQNYEKSCLELATPTIPSMTRCAHGYN